MAFDLPPLPFPKEPGTNTPYIATPDEGGGYTVPSGHYFKKKVGDLYLWVPVSESDPLPTDNANIDVALSALRDALLGTGNKTLSDLATALAPLATSEKQAALVSALGVIADAAVSDPAASGTVVSLLKGLLSQLQAGSPVSVTESNLPTGAATAAQQEASRAILDSLNGKDYSTAAKQDAIAGLVGALDAVAVSDPTAAGAVIALLKGLLSRLQTLEGKIDGITDGTAPAKTELTGSIVEETTLQNEVIAPADGTTVAMGGRDKIKIEITGTATSSTVVFEVAGASGVFVPVQGVRLSDYTIATQTGSKNEIWAIDSIVGLTFRARVSAVAGGNITVVGLVVA